MIYLLFFIAALGALLRICPDVYSVPFFADQAWFFLSARDALLTGRLPLLGITSSITWLHQGPLYTYLIIPGLALSRFNPVSTVYLSIIIGTFTMFLSYIFSRVFFKSRVIGLLSAFILSISPLAILYDRTAYHTTPVPLFMLITLLCLHKRRFFLSGLFLGFLYQLHLLTLLLWLPILVFFYYKKFSVFIFLSGFTLGILPFILSGPLQVGGIFIWLAVKIFTGFSGALSIGFFINLASKLYFPAFFLPIFRYLPSVPGSEAYFSLLIVPLVMLASFILSKFRFWLLVIISAAMLISNVNYFITNNYMVDRPGFSPSLRTKMLISQNIFLMSATASPLIDISGNGGEFLSTKMPYQYLIWWLSLTRKPLGEYSRFTVNDQSGTYSVLK